MILVDENNKVYISQGNQRSFFSSDSDFTVIKNKTLTDRKREKTKMKIIDQLKKVNLIQFVPAIFVISLVGNSVFGYTAPKSEKSKIILKISRSCNDTSRKRKQRKQNAGDIDLSKIKDGTYEGQANGYRGLVKVSVTVKDHKITAIKVLVIPMMPHFSIVHQQV